MPFTRTVLVFQMVSTKYKPHMTLIEQNLNLWVFLRYQKNNSSKTETNKMLSESKTITNLAEVTFLFRYFIISYMFSAECKNGMFGSLFYRSYCFYVETVRDSTFNHTRLFAFYDWIIVAKDCYFQMQNRTLFKYCFQIKWSMQV